MESSSETDFRKTVQARDSGLCVICGDAASTVQDIMDRRLWDDGGLYADNGASLCHFHAAECLATRIDLETLRVAAGVPLCIPPQLYAMQRYDRWGNPVLKDGRRARGELFFHPDVQRQVRVAGLLDSFSHWVKYPRTYLLPWSESTNEGERDLASIEPFMGRRVVLTEKMDGENVTLYRDFMHTRSVETHRHASREWLEWRWQEIRERIPPGWRICGEYVFAKHTIEYANLPSYFLGFSVWNERNVCLDWDATRAFMDIIGMACVPVLYDGIFDLSRIDEVWRRHGGPHSEGYVMRLADEIPYRDFRRLAGKFIRADYRQSEPVKRNIQHGEPIRSNALIDPAGTQG